MATNMNFGTNILPTSNDSLTIGSNSKKWKIYGRNYGEISHPKDLITKEYADNIVQISDNMPTDENNKIWISEDETLIPVEVPTVQEALALGITNASIDQSIKINGINEDGEPVSWIPTNFIEVNQGSVNAGKILVVNAQGNLTLMTKDEWENSL